MRSCFETLSQVHLPHIKKFLENKAVRYYYVVIGDRPKDERRTLNDPGRLEIKVRKLRKERE